MHRPIDSDRGREYHSRLPSDTIMSRRIFLFSLSYREVSLIPSLSFFLFLSRMNRLYCIHLSKEGERKKRYIYIYYMRGIDRPRVECSGVIEIEIMIAIVVVGVIVIVDWSEME